jgi:hypothetical protein
MDKTRESRRSSINGFPKRKHRNITLRDSSGMYLYDFLLFSLYVYLYLFFLPTIFSSLTEEVAVELKEVQSKRGLGRNQDRELVNRSKRRRSSHSYVDETEQSSEERFGNEHDDHARDAGLSRIRLSNTTSFVSDQNLRRKFTPAKSPPFMRTDEMIGVVVPRKARSG